MAKEHKKSFGTIYTQVGVRPPDGTSNRHKFAFSVHCTKRGCDATETIEHQKPGVNPDEFAAKFRTKGWRISGQSKAICPGCQKRSPTANDNDGDDTTNVVKLPHALQPDTLLGKSFEPVTEIIHSAEFVCEEATTMNATTALTTPVTAVAMAASDTSASAMRTSEKLMLAETYLDQYYVRVEGDTGYYKPGGSDADGAALSHLTLERFVQMREEEYGKIIDFVGIADNANRTIEAAQRAVGQIDTELSKLQKYRLDTEPLPAALRDFLEGVKIQHDQLKTDNRARVERCVAKFDEDLDGEYVKIRDKVNEAWENERRKADDKLLPEVEALVSQRDGLERTIRTMSELAAKLPAEMLQAAE